MKPSSYPVLNNRPIDQWRVTELKEELKKRKLVTRGLKEELVRRLGESLRSEMDSPDQEEVESGSDDDSEPKGDADETTPIANESVSEAPKVDRGDDIVLSDAEDQADGKNIDVHDDSQPKGNADEMTSIANADEMTSIANADEMTPIANADEITPIANADEITPIANADEITPIVNADEITPVANESVSEAPKADKGVDIVVNDAEEQADGKNIDFLGDSQPKGNADEMTPIANADEITPIVNADEITPVANESVSEAPKADKGVDIVVNDAEEQADGKNIDFLGDSQPKGNADEMTPIANESVSEAPKGVDIVVNDAEEQADGKNIDVLGDSQPKGNADEMTPIADESVSEALGVDLVLKDEENQAVGKTLEVDNASSQAVDDDNGKISDENLGQQAGEMTHASPAVKDEAATDEKSVEMSIAASEVVSSVAAISGQGSENKQAQLDAEDIKPSDEEVNQNMSDLNNQVSEVSPSLGFPVKNDSNSTDSVSINKMNELKDNIIADDVKLESDVKHELVQPSSSPIVPDGGISCPMDVEEPQNKVSVDETKNSVKDEEMSKKISSADVGSPEKLNLDRSSCDDSMEEDTLENKQVDSTYISDEVGGSDEKTVVTMVKEEIRVDIMGDDLSAAKKDGHGEDMVGIAASTEKRKLPDDQEPVTNNEPFKRQRKWKTESVQASEPQCSSPALSTTPRGVPPAPGLKRSFSRSNSNADDEAPKERVVPPPLNPPTDSLRIDNFVRPFTLKAVQEFLGKTGTVTSFWMDHIKTHCYVTYSSVEEATETRNAVCNLQWPPNGGRLLTAEFVDAQEVKSHVDGPPQPPTPVAPANAPPAAPLLPSPRQLGPRQKQLLQTNLPPPPPLTNPPPVRERLQPPPPPPPEKVEPPVVTLDDLFRKTKMTPRIYYLPLSEEQVSAKLAAAQHRNSKP